MKGRNKVWIVFLAAVFVLGCAASSFAVTLAPQWSAPVKFNPIDGVEYIARSVEVDNTLATDGTPLLTTGDIYIACDKNNSRIVKLNKDGNLLASWGPNMRIPYMGTTYTVAISGYLGLSGVAIDPKTGKLYVGFIDGLICPVDKTQPTGDLVVPLQNWFFCSFPRMGGCAFSPDGMKFAVIGILGDSQNNPLQDPGKCGIQLFSRNLNNTPDDYTDDTWTAEATMTQPGNKFLGLSEYYCTPDVTSYTPRDLAFSPDGSAVYTCDNRAALKFSTTAPYGVTELIGTYGPRWGIEVDEYGNIITGSGSTDAMIGAMSIVFNDSRTGVRLDQGTISDIPTPQNVAWDKYYNRLIVAGKDANISGWVQSYTLTGLPVLPNPAVPTNIPDDFFYLTGTVKDEAGNGIPNAKIGLADIVLGDENAMTAPKINGSSCIATSGADGSFACYLPISMDSKNLVMEVEASGYLKQRRMKVTPVYNDNMQAEQPVNVVLKSQTANSIVWNAPTFIGSTKIDRQTTEDGLIQHMMRYGARKTFTTDPVTAQNCYQIGTDENLTYGSTDNYMYLDIDDNWKPGGSALTGRAVYLKVTYLDHTDITDAIAGGDALSIDADCGLYGIRTIASMLKTNPWTENWKTKTFKFVVPDTAFGNRLVSSSFDSGQYTTNTPAFADIRISANKDLPYDNNMGPDWIKSVEITTVEDTPPNVWATIKDVKNVPVGNPIMMTNQFITAQYGGKAFYIGNTTRTDGLKITSGNAAVPGLINLISFPIGFTGTRQVNSSGEPYILADAVFYDPTVAPTEIRPLAITGKTANMLSGINMTGLRVKVTGKVSNVVPSILGVSDGSFMVDDGSGAVKVVMDASVDTNFWPVSGDYVVVDGIASLTDLPPAVTRAIKPWGTAVGPADGTFESATPLTNWGAYVNPSCSGTITVSPTAHSGSNSIAFTCNTPYYTPNGYETIYHPDSILNTGQPYTLSAWFKATNNGANNKFYDWQDTWYEFYIPSGTYDWRLVSKLFNSAPYRTLETRILVQDLVTELLVDDIKWQPIAGGIQILNR